MAGKILVTGCAGFIGYHTCARLLRDGCEVIGADNMNDYYDVQLKHDRLRRIAAESRFRFERVSVSDKDAMESLFREAKPTHVIHLAAQAGVRHSLTHPHDYADANLTGFLNVLEGCRNHEVRHLLFASSSSVYGAGARLPYSVHDNVDHPVSLYAATKKANELMAHAYAHLYGIPVTGLRFFTVYGPWGRPDMAYFTFTKAILEGRPIQVNNHGRMKRDFTYIDDIVEGIVRLLERPAAPDPDWDAVRPDPGSSMAPYRIYNIGNHKSVALPILISILEKLLGMEAEQECREMQKGDVVETYADIADLRRDTGFEPATDLHTGLARFVEWYQGYYLNGDRGAGQEESR